MEDHDSLISLGERIRNKRRRSGLTQTELAARIGYSSNGLAKIERGESDPKFSALVRISTALGITIRWLVAPQTDSEAQRLDEILESVEEIRETYRDVLNRLSHSQG